MKKDIKFPKVEGVSIAIARQQNELNQTEWNVFLINKNDFPLTNVLVTSKGYGVQNGEEQKTSVLRHHISRLEAGEYALIEPINPEIFHLNNEFWLSYFVGEQIFDKKFIFLAESIIEDNVIFIPEINMEGILHN
ncbi:MAG: hypothetical protein K2X86_14195 [Cytophagaceae bacterium]|nr:hypothetical protein [Cytophagaceae bacterium]